MLLWESWQAIKMVILLFGLLLMLNYTGAVIAETGSFHFVLVHGAGHGAWCWYKVAERLEKGGHRVDAVDLLSAGINRFNPSEIGTLENYSSPLVGLIQRLHDDEKVVLVGHSLGGASLTYMLEKFPSKIAAAVYVAALMLPSGPDASTLNSQLLSRLQASFMIDTSSGSAPAFKLEAVQDLLYNVSPLRDVILAKSLLKPVPLFDPSVNFTQARYGSAPRYFIKTKQDNVILPQDQDLLIRTTPPTGVFQIDSDHAPFFSKPHALARHLVRIARKSLRTKLQPT